MTFLLVVTGCDSTGVSSGEENPPEESEDGAVSLALARAANSDVPSDADSAFVRIWKPDGNYNLSELVDIPDPGQQTVVSFDVPSDQGYQAGILAVASDNSPRAHGSSASFEVQPGDTTSVNLDVRPVELVLEAPDTLVAGRSDTVSITYTVNASDIEEDIRLRQSNDSSFFYNSGEIPDQVSDSKTDSTTTEKFEISSPNTDNLGFTYLKPRTSLFNAEEWLTADSFLSFRYYPSRDGPAFTEIPVKPEGSSSGIVIITFSKNGDSWEKTRVPVD